MAFYSAPQAALSFVWDRDDSLLRSWWMADMIGTASLLSKANLLFVSGVLPF